MSSIKDQIDNNEEYKNLPIKKLEKYFEASVGSNDIALSHDLEKVKETVYSLQLILDKEFATVEYEKWIHNEYNKYIMTDVWYDAYKKNIEFHLRHPFIDSVIPKDNYDKYIELRVVDNIYKILKLDFDKATEKFSNRIDMTLNLRDVPNIPNVADIFKYYNSTGFMFIDSSKIHKDRNYIKLNPVV
jgi:hypothetical protein